MLKEIEGEIALYINKMISAAPADVECLYLEFREISDGGPVGGGAEKRSPFASNGSEWKILYSIGTLGYRSLFNGKEYPLDRGDWVQLESPIWTAERELEYYEEQLQKKELLRIVVGPKVLSEINNWRAMRIYAGWPGRGLNGFARLEGLRSKD